MSSRSSVWTGDEYTVPPTNTHGEKLRMKSVHVYADCDLDGWLFVDGTFDESGRWGDGVFALPPEAVSAIIRNHEFEVKFQRKGE